MYSSRSKIRVGITIGDPSGIGPAITLKAISKLKGLANFIVIGDRWVLSKIKNLPTKSGSRLKVGKISNIKYLKFELVDLKNVNKKNFRLGRVEAEYGRASIEYLDKALELLRNNAIDCLVTCPISKEAINLAGYHYSGHTEYFSEKTHSQELVMMLLNKNLKISLLTRHVPLKEVPMMLSSHELEKNIAVTIKALRELFLILKPRLVVCGLNPHASDNGLIGDEETRFIQPIVEKLRVKFKLRIDGPFSSDVAIYKANRKEYDAAIAMYHDQALIPLKLLGNQSGVNITLGLPFIRTSPLHGTAFDIAHNPRLCDPRSLMEAIRLAVKCALNLKKN